jgi:hypothetical protein
MAASGKRTSERHCKAEYRYYKVLKYRTRDFRAGRLAMIRGVTAVSPITVAIFAGPNRLPIEAVSEADAGVQGMV